MQGALTVWTLAQLPPEPAARLELSGLTRLDTAGAWYLAGRQAAGATLEGLAAPQARLLDSVTRALPRPDAQPATDKGWRRMLDSTGRWMVGALVFLRELAEYLGRFLAALWRGIRHPGDFRLTSLVWHCQKPGCAPCPSWR